MRKIAVIAPAGTMADLNAELRALGRARLRTAGFDVVFGKHVDERHRHTAGTLSQRLEDFHAAVDDNTVDVIMPVFGGYNSNQLLPYLDYERIAHVGKPIVGYSDITALLVAFDKLGQAPAIHGPGFATFCDPGLFGVTLSSFLDAIDGRAQVHVAPSEVADDLWYVKKGYGPRELRSFSGWRVYRPGEAHGALMGGNLETFAALAGTPFFPRLDGHLLFLEDTNGQSPGRFHRELTQLAQLGVFARIAGLMIGLLPHASPLGDPACLADVLDDVIGATPFPVLLDVNCSHTDPILSFRLNATATMTSHPTPRLSVDGCPVTRRPRRP